MAKYVPTPKDRENVDSVFTYHPPLEGSDQVARYGLLRAQAKNLAETIITNCPPSRETSLAITNLQQAVMWANAAIACHES